MVDLLSQLFNMFRPKSKCHAQRLNKTVNLLWPLNTVEITVSAIRSFIQIKQRKKHWHPSNLNETNYRNNCIFIQNGNSQRYEKVQNFALFIYVVNKRYR